MSCTTMCRHIYSGQVTPIQALSTWLYGVTSNALQVSSCNDRTYLQRALPVCKHALQALFEASATTHFSAQRIPQRVVSVCVMAGNFRHHNEPATRETLDGKSRLKVSATKYDKSCKIPCLYSAQVPPKATVITEAELAQMKRRAVITSLADEEAARVEREKMLEVQSMDGSIVLAFSFSLELGIVRCLYFYINTKHHRSIRRLDLEQTVWQYG